MDIEPLKIIVRERADREYLNFKLDDFNFNYNTPFDKINNMDFPFIYIIDGLKWEVRAKPINEKIKIYYSEMHEFSESLDLINQYLKTKSNRTVPVDGELVMLRPERECVEFVDFDANFHINIIKQINKFMHNQYCVDQVQLKSKHDHTDDSLTFDISIGATGLILEKWGKLK
jgi:hypothetical protein